MARPAETMLLPTVAELVDTLGPVEAALETPEAVVLLAKMKTAQALRKQIAERIDADPAETVTVKGQHYTAVIGARENSTKIRSMAKVFALLKRATFLANCSFTLSALKELAPEQYPALVVTERTGSRSVKTFARTEKPAAQKAA